MYNTHNSPCKPLTDYVKKSDKEHETLNEKLTTINEKIAVLNGKFDMYIKLKEGQMFLDRVKANENPGDWNKLLIELKKDK